MIDYLVEREHFCHSPQETEALARKLAQALAATGQLPLLLLLCGGLGTGKTVFAQGIAQGLGIAEALQSPTFPILLEYPGSAIPLYHFDLYRLRDCEEFDLIGGEDILYGDASYGPGLCLIEWPERLDWLNNSLGKTDEVRPIEGFRHTDSSRLSSLPGFVVELAIPGVTNQRTGDSQQIDYMTRSIRISRLLT